MLRWIIFVVVFLLIELYAFQVIKTVTKLTWVYWSWWVLVALVVVNLVYQFYTGEDSRALSPLKSYAIGFMMTLMVASLVMLVAVFAEDIARLFIGVGRKLVGSETGAFLPDRRKFVSQIALGLAAIPFGSMIYGMVYGKYNFRVIRHTMTFKDLPEAFDGFRITQISDIHSGSFDNPDKVQYAIDLINEQASDLILFTGDLVNNEAKEMLPWIDMFSKLKADSGMYSVLGNHDYGDYVSWKNEEEKEQNLEQLKKVHEKIGFNLLLNEHLYLERGNDKVALVGVENWGAGGFKKAGDLKKATEGLSREEFKILMSHDPSHWEHEIKANELHYHLTLSGHTHGMQFGIEIPGWIKWSPVQWRYKHWAGMYEEKGEFLHVNRGLGYLAFPGRVGIWPEITVIELKKG
jgi:predicted MPP superfamily phosphohydrolase